VNSAPLEFLFSLERFGMKFGLANMARLVEALGHPEHAFASVLIGGTNGKGSVTAMTEAALRAAGHRVARYTSPHLVRLEERFVIDGREIGSSALESSAARVQAAAERLVADGTLDHLPTFFECTTAIAFDLFREAGVSLALLEVGLGGRLDATNIVSPIAAAIVSIDFDHQAQLGHTLSSIAAEKAGIVRPGIPVVCGQLPAEALGVIVEICSREGARLIRADLDVASQRVARDAMTFVTPRTTVRDVRLALAGLHQAGNAAVAVRLLDELHDLGYTTDADSVRTGLERTVWPARLERFTIGGCRLLVDAAHNPAGARALASYLREHAPEGVTLVFGAMKDKAVDEMLAALASVATLTICTTAPTPRAMEADRLAELARPRHVRVDVEPDPYVAVARACQASSSLVVIAGSIFLVGPVRDRLARDILR
jgi:dihydrofolate synthase / folylpolyglutamate synthase